MQAIADPQWRAMECAQATDSNSLTVLYKAQQRATECARAHQLKLQLSSTKLSFNHILTPRQQHEFVLKGPKTSSFLCEAQAHQEETTRKGGDSNSVLCISAPPSDK